MYSQVVYAAAAAVFGAACTDFDFAVPLRPDASPAPTVQSPPAPDARQVPGYPESLVVSRPSVLLKPPGLPGAVVKPNDPIDHENGADDGGVGSPSAQEPPHSDTTSRDAGDELDGPDESDEPPSDPTAVDAGDTLDAPAIVWLAQVCTDTRMVVLTTSGCQTLNGDVCFEGETYETATAAFATGDIRVCEGVTEVRAYAYPALSQRARSRGADGFHARVDVYDAEGEGLGSVFDGTADSVHSTWTAFPGATHIVISAYIFGYESGPRP
jgi:hypothetical protein